MWKHKYAANPEPGVPETSSRIEASRNLMLISISSGIGLGCIALFWLFGALVAEKEIIGQISFFLSLATIFAGAAQMGLGMSKMTLFPEKKDRRILEQFDVVSALAAFCAVVFLGLLSGNPLLYAVLVISQVVYGMTINDYLAGREYTRCAFWVIVCRGGQFAIGSTMLWGGYDPQIVAIGYSAPLLLIAPRYLKNIVGAIINPGVDMISRHRSMLAHLGSVFLLRTMSGYLDKVVAGLVFGFVVLGEYQFIFQVFLLLQFFPSSVLSYLVPERAAGSKGSILTKVSAFGAISIAILGLAGCGPLISIYLPAYEATIPAIWIICVTIIPATLASVCISRLMTSNRTIYLVASYVVAFVVQYSIILTISASLGLLGLALGLLGGQVALFLSTAVMARQMD